METPEQYNEQHNMNYRTALIMMVKDYGFINKL